MTKMHENELEIDEGLVHTLIKNQCPHWANLSLKSIVSSGTDNALFRLGNDYVVRLPRVEWEIGRIHKNITKECEWLPKVAQLLKMAISEPLFKGSPSEFYPWPWTVTKWHAGHNPAFEKDNEYALLAKDLADFLNDLHGIELPNGPKSRRGVSLKEVDQETRKAISALEGEIDTQMVTSLWSQLANIPVWNKAPVWIHGDFLPGNIIIQHNRLSAVIDFSDVGMGDPACDLVIVWSLLNANSRSVFRQSLVNIDDNTWERGRGWALSIALIMLPYYKNSNPVLATLARRIIEHAL
ncbi:MAG: aminoglycoside phosphotransferase family protein [Legionellaceae bacterium]|nr:aminoglycoside phosphotransferase family protein [Legionellaceae bacterium]MBP9776110.1 aminoglycoside phosphotransferase family protein [Legionellaceae bacterium]